MPGGHLIYYLLTFSLLQQIGRQIISTGLLVVLKRPGVAGLMVLIVALARVFYALGYRSNIRKRFPFFLVSQFAGLVGVGYGALAAASLIHMGPFVDRIE
jgi:multisubunit Na+/H+ antiporter MnhB subunit